MRTDVQAVRDVVVSTLGIEDRTDLITEETALLGGVPELDSMALLDLVTALEQRFEIVIEDEDITGETFATLGSLAARVRARAEETAAG